MIAPAAGPGTRPGAVTVAGVVLIVFGVLVTLLGLLLVLGGVVIGSLGNAPDLQDQLGGIRPEFGPFIAVLGLILVSFGIAQIVSGIYVLPGRSWARITGLIVAVLGALLALVGVVPGNEDVNLVGIIIALAVLAGYVLTTWALITNGRWFASR